ncbi:hypothetical protein M885DRAFT_519586 [Pelagophyceae sp. CCMP2097]|nr:hypothetical protein M885DRAFT_519586 [Pelagophyceae sp. CCMP2097]
MDPATVFLWELVTRTLSRRPRQRDLVKGTLSKGPCQRDLVKEGGRPRARASKAAGRVVEGPEMEPVFDESRSSTSLCRPSTALEGPSRGLCGPRRPSAARPLARGGPRESLGKPSTALCGPLWRPSTARCGPGTALCGPSCGRAPKRAQSRRP